MRKNSLIIALFAFFLAQTSFAGGGDTIKECEAIVDACKSAGFTDEGTGDKSLWFGCLKPVLHDKSVNGVTVDKKDVKECRKAKIAKMKKEIKELESVK